MKEYIERADLYEAMNSQDCEFSLIDALALIEEFPAADVAPTRHGRWIDSSNGWMCSECEQDNTYDKPWCPNCGARMDKEDDHD